MWNLPCFFSPCSALSSGQPSARAFWTQPEVVAPVMMATENTVSTSLVMDSSVVPRSVLGDYGLLRRFAPALALGAGAVGVVAGVGSDPPEPLVFLSCFSA